ncbi:MAG: MarR family winged helix-turn-helix transcriptional regulator [Candidatus Thiodiazotropha sp.]
MYTNKIHSYLERLSNLLRSEMRRTGSDAGLQPVQIDALHYLSTCNRYSDTPMGVTEYLGQTKGTVSQTLKVLERKGLLKRKVDREDKRVTHLRVTPAGRHLLDRMVPTVNFIDACQLLDQKTQGELETSLHTLLRSVQRAAGSKTFGVCHTCRYNRYEGEGRYYCELVNAGLSEADVQLICREHEDAA